jgi:hypothetical protein
VSGAKRTSFRSRGPSSTCLENCTASIAPRTIPRTVRSVVFQTSVVTVKRAVASDGSSSWLTTCGCRSASGPLSVRYTSPQSPMFLSAGVGFQSTHMKARSWGSGANTSTARAFDSPRRASRVTSNSKRRKAPTTSRESAIGVPFNQMLAR